MKAGQAHGISLFLVPNDADGLSVQALNTVDSHGAAHLTLEDVAVGEDQVIGAVDAGWEVLEPALDRGRIALAAEALGSAQAAFDMTLEYMQTRKQFGQLIGSFQSLQHRAAKMFTELELTRSCVAAALVRRSMRIAMMWRNWPASPRPSASDLIHLVSNETVQFHGGIGMTDAHDSGLYHEACTGAGSPARRRLVSP